MRASQRSFLLFILLSTVGFALASCGESGPTRVAEIMITADENGSAGNPVESLKPDNNPIHAIVHLSRAGGSVAVKMELIAVETTEGNNVPVVTESKIVEGLNNQVDFTISLPRPWPTGTYRVDAYLNDSLSMSKEYQIKK